MSNKLLSFLSDELKPILKMAIELRDKQTDLYLAQCFETFVVEIENACLDVQEKSEKYNE